MNSVYSYTPIKKTCAKPLAMTLAGLFFVQQLAFSAPNAALSTSEVGAAQPVSANHLIHNPSEIKIPFEHVSLKEIHRSATKSKLIILLEDAHTNMSGQVSLAKALDELIQQYGIDLILTEGSSKDVTLDELKPLADEKSWKVAAKRFLQEGIIAGEEYLNLTSNHNLTIHGVEFQDLYDRGLEAYSDLLEKREDALAYLRDIRISIQVLKDRLYPKVLRQYESALKGSREKSAILSEWDLLESLLDRTNIAIESYSEITKLKLIRYIESELDFSKIEAEIEILNQQLLRDGHQEAVKGYREYMRKNSSSQTTHLLLLKSLIGLRGGSIDSEFPTLSKYMRYLESFVELDFGGLLDQMAALENRIFNDLLKDNEDARKLRAVDQFTKLMQKAYRIQMSSREFKQLADSQSQFLTKSWEAFLNEELIEVDKFENLIPYKPVFEESNGALHAFYKSVDERDFAFLKNANRIMDERNTNISFLIAGGYHTEHLTELMKSQGDISYVVLTPKVTQETDHERYERLLMMSLPDKPETAENSSSLHAIAKMMKLESPMNSRMSAKRFALISDNIWAVDPKEVADFSGDLSAVRLKNSNMSHSSVLHNSARITHFSGQFSIEDLKVALSALREAKSALLTLVDHDGTPNSYEGEVRNVVELLDQTIPHVSKASVGRELLFTGTAAYADLELNLEDSERKLMSMLTNLSESLNRLEQDLDEPGKKEELLESYRSLLMTYMYLQDGGKLLGLRNEFSSLWPEEYLLTTLRNNSIIASAEFVKFQFKNELFKGSQMKVRHIDFIWQHLLASNDWVKADEFLNALFEISRDQGNPADISSISVYRDLKYFEKFSKWVGPNAQKHMSAAEKNTFEGALAYYKSKNPFNNPLFQMEPLLDTVLVDEHSIVKAMGVESESEIYYMPGFNFVTFSPNKIRVFNVKNDKKYEIDIVQGAADVRMAAKKVLRPEDIRELWKVIYGGLDAIAYQIVDLRTSNSERQPGPTPSLTNLMNDVEIIINAMRNVNGVIKTYEASIMPIHLESERELAAVPAELLRIIDLQMNFLKKVISLMSQEMLAPSVNSQSHIDDMKTLFKRVLHNIPVLEKAIFILSDELDFGKPHWSDDILKTLLRAGVPNLALLLLEFESEMGRFDDEVTKNTHYVWMIEHYLGKGKTAEALDMIDYLNGDAETTRSLYEFSMDYSDYLSYWNEIAVENNELQMSAESAERLLDLVRDQSMKLPAWPELDALKALLESGGITREVVRDKFPDTPDEKIYYFPGFHFLVFEEGEIKVFKAKQFAEITRIKISHANSRVRMAKALQSKDQYEDRISELRLVQKHLNDEEDEALHTIQDRVKIKRLESDEVVFVASMIDLVSESKVGLGELIDTDDDYFYDVNFVAQLRKFRSVHRERVLQLSSIVGSVSTKGSLAEPFKNLLKAMLYVALKVDQMELEIGYSRSIYQDETIIFDYLLKMRLIDEAFYFVQLEDEFDIRESINKRTERYKFLIEHRLAYGQINDVKEFLESETGPQDVDEKQMSDIDRYLRPIYQDYLDGPYANVVMRRGVISSEITKALAQDASRNTLRNQHSWPRQLLAIQDIKVDVVRKKFEMRDWTQIYYVPGFNFIVFKSKSIHGYNALLDMEFNIPIRNDEERTPERGSAMAKSNRLDPYFNGDENAHTIQEAINSMEEASGYLSNIASGFPDDLAVNKIHEKFIKNFKNHIRWSDSDPLVTDHSFIHDLPGDDALTIVQGRTKAVEQMMKDLLLENNGLGAGRRIAALRIVLASLIEDWKVLDKITMSDPRGSAKSPHSAHFMQITSSILAVGKALQLLDETFGEMQIGERVKEKASRWVFDLQMNYEQYEDAFRYLRAHVFRLTESDPNYEEALSWIDLGLMQSLKIPSQAMRHKLQGILESAREKIDNKVRDVQDEEPVGGHDFFDPELDLDEYGLTRSIPSSPLEELDAANDNFEIALNALGFTMLKRVADDPIAEMTLIPNDDLQAVFGKFQGIYDSRQWKSQDETTLLQLLESLSLQIKALHFDEQLWKEEGLVDLEKIRKAYQTLGDFTPEALKHHASLLWEVYVLISAWMFKHDVLDSTDITSELMQYFLKISSIEWAKEVVSRPEVWVDAQKRSVYLRRMADYYFFHKNNIAEGLLFLREITKDSEVVNQFRLDYVERLVDRNKLSAAERVIQQGGFSQDTTHRVYAYEKLAVHHLVENKAYSRAWKYANLAHASYDMLPEKERSPVLESYLDELHDSIALLDAVQQRQTQIDAEAAERIERLLITTGESVDRAVQRLSTYIDDFDAKRYRTLGILPLGHSNEIDFPIAVSRDVRSGATKLTILNHDGNVQIIQAVRAARMASSRIPFNQGYSKKVRELVEKVLRGVSRILEQEGIELDSGVDIDELDYEIKVEYEKYENWIDRRNRATSPTYVFDFQLEEDWERGYVDEEGLRIVMWSNFHKLAAFYHLLNASLERNNGIDDEYEMFAILNIMIAEVQNHIVRLNEYKDFDIQNILLATTFLKLSLVHAALELNEDVLGSMMSDSRDMVETFGEGFLKSTIDVLSNSDYIPDSFDKAADILQSDRLSALSLPGKPEGRIRYLMQLSNIYFLELMDFGKAKSLIDTARALIEQLPEGSRPGFMGQLKDMENAMYTLFDDTNSSPSAVDSQSGNSHTSLEMAARAIKTAIAIISANNSKAILNIVEASAQNFVDLLDKNSLSVRYLEPLAANIIAIQRLIMNHQEVEHDEALNELMPNYGRYDDAILIEYQAALLEAFAYFLKWAQEKEVVDEQLLNVMRLWMAEGRHGLAEQFVLEDMFWVTMFYDVEFKDQLIRIRNEAKDRLVKHYLDRKLDDEIKPTLEAIWNDTKIPEHQKSLQVILELIKLNKVVIVENFLNNSAYWGDEVKRVESYVALIYHYLLDFNDIAVAHELFTKAQDLARKHYQSSPQLIQQMNDLFAALGFMDLFENTSFSAGPTAYLRELKLTALRKVEPWMTPITVVDIRESYPDLFNMAKRSFENIFDENTRTNTSFAILNLKSQYPDFLVAIRDSGDGVKKIFLIGQSRQQSAELMPVRLADGALKSLLPSNNLVTHAFNSEDIRRVDVKQKSYWFGHKIIPISYPSMADLRSNVRHARTLNEKSTQAAPFSENGVGQEQVDAVQYLEELRTHWASFKQTRKVELAVSEEFIKLIGGDESFKGLNISIKDFLKGLPIQLNIFPLKSKPNKRVNKVSRGDQQQDAVATGDVLRYGLLATQGDRQLIDGNQSLENQGVFIAGDTVNSNHARLAVLTTLEILLSATTRQELLETQPGQLEMLSYGRSTQDERLERFNYQGNVNIVFAKPMRFTQVLTDAIFKAALFRMAVDTKA